MLEMEAFFFSRSLSNLRLERLSLEDSSEPILIRELWIKLTKEEHLRGSSLQIRNSGEECSDTNICQRIHTCGQPRSNYRQELQSSFLLS